MVDDFFNPNEFEVSHILAFGGPVPEQRSIIPYLCPLTDRSCSLTPAALNDQMAVPATQRPKVLTSWDGIIFRIAPELVPGDISTKLGRPVVAEFLRSSTDKNLTCSGSVGIWR